MTAPVPLHSSASFAQRGGGALDLHEAENRKLRTRLSKLEKEHEELKRVYLRLSLWTKEKASITGQELYSFLQNSEALPSRDHDDLGPEEVTAPDVTESGGGRFFEAIQDLEGSQGHQGPVYICRFSRRGNLLASGSFDKSVKVWRFENAVACETFNEHSLNVGDLSWSVDDQWLVSGGYDKTVKCYDVQGVKMVSSYDLSGFVLSVTFNPLEDTMIWAGTSQSTLHLIDRRASAPVFAFKNEVGAASMVNALDMPAGPGAGFKLLSGDSRGMIKIWDVRAVDPNNPLCESAIRNGDGAKPISDLHLQPGAAVDEPGFLSVNSYDDVLRVYHRPSQSSEAAQGAPPLRLAHSLLGHRNKNFPIRSHTYRGSRYTPRATAASGLPVDPLHQASAPSAAQHGGARAGIERSIILATGSADKSCYLYDIGGPQPPELIQRLEGHGDRVYCANFHPSKALLATASADHRIKLWAPASKR